MGIGLLIALLILTVSFAFIGIKYIKGKPYKGALAFLVLKPGTLTLEIFAILEFSFCLSK